MKKAFLLFIACGLLAISTYAQVSDYIFSQSSATYTAITGGKVLGSTSIDEQFFVDSTVVAGGTTTSGIGLPIGFDFTYNGNDFDVFAINTNGWISLGQSALAPLSVDMTSTTVTTPISTASSASAILQNRVSALGCNLAGQTGSELRYETIGTYPNRTLVVQWKGFKKSGSLYGDNINFQIRLNETLNTVQFVYGTFTSYLGSATPQVGLRGETNTDYNNRLSTTSWATTTAGTGPGSTVTLSATVYPASGLTFTYTMPVYYQFDAGITAINSPVTPVSNGFNKVGVTIKNFGTDSLLSAIIGWSVNGAVQTPFMFTNVGVPKDSVFHIDSIGTYNFSVGGNCVIKAWSSQPDANADENNANDTVTKTVLVQGYAPLPFHESFNSTWINFYNTRDVPSIYWMNTPNTGNSSWRRNDDGASAAWTTSTNGAYTPTGVGTGTLYSARFHSRSATVGSTGTLDAFINFSAVGTKNLKFWHINTSGTDTLFIFMSNDGGTSFNLIQKFATTTPANTWVQRSVDLGNSTAPHTIVRFQVKNLTSGTGTTDVGIDSVQVNSVVADDAGLTAINTPVTPVIQGINPVAVTIKNYGSNNLTSANIHWSVNGIPQTPYSFSNTTGLVTNATAGPDTIGNYNFTTPGNNIIKAWTTSPNGVADINNINDTVTKVVYVQAYAPIPFTEGFNNAWINKNDTNDVPSVYWANTPAYGNNSWRRDDDTLSAPWTEGSGGTYTPAGASGTAHSARFHTWYAPTNSKGVMDLFLNFSTFGCKILDFWYINADGADSLTVYLSTDNGATFGLIQKLQTAANWSHYNFNIGTSAAPNCIIRFRASSDYGQTDIGLDQVKVYLQPNNDMAALEWVSPVSGCALTNAEPVIIKVKNVGFVAQSHIPVKYSIDGGNTIVGPEYIPGPVNPGDTATFTFNTTADFSNGGSYVCGFVVKLPGDTITLNDTAFANIILTSKINSFPFAENFNTGTSNYFILSANANSNILYDTIGTQSTYGLQFTGKTTASWTSGTTSAAAAWANTTHQSSALTCSVNASNISTLKMKFDLRQTSSNTTNFTYSWFTVIANGTDTLVDKYGKKFFNPASANNDAFSTKYFDLSGYTNSIFDLKFVSSCRRDDANSTIGSGDNVYFDNLAIYVPPTINDLGPDTSICENNPYILNAGAGIGYSYLWTEMPSGDTISTAQTITVDSTGKYIVVVTNAYGYSSSDSVTVTVIPAPVANAGNDTIIPYQTAYTLQGLATSGTGHFSYLWSPDSLLVDATIQNPTTISMLHSAIFTLTVTDSITGCTGTDQVIVYISGGPLSVIASTNPGVICSGECVSLMALPSGGSGVYNYTWTSTPAASTSNLANPIFCPTVNTTFHVVVDDGSTQASANIDVIVNQLPTVNLGNDTIICANNNITLTVNPAATSYLWSTGATSQSIIVDSTYAIAGIATIWVTAINSSGCSKTDTIVITFDPCTGINENSNNNTVVLYPNPTTGMTNIVINGFTDAILNIYNIQGAAVYTEQIKSDNTTVSKQLDLSYLPKGLYLIRIYNENVSKLCKLVIQ